MNQILNNVVAPIGLLLILASTATPFFLMHTAWAQQAYPFVYLAGAVLLLGSRLFTKYNCTDVRLRALHRMEKWTPLLFLVAVLVLFYKPDTLRDWLAFTLAGALIQIYTSLAIPAREKKIAKKDKV